MIECNGEAVLAQIRRLPVRLVDEKPPTLRSIRPRVDDYATPLR